MSDVAENPRAVAGDNRPPLSPAEAMAVHVGDLMETAQGFLDGEPITTQPVADEVGKLLAAAREAEKDADAQRKAEAKPFDEGKAAVQALWKPIIGKCELVAATAKKALAPFLIAEQARHDAEAAEACRLADEKAETAQQALRQADATDLAAQEQAETLLKDAERAERTAARAGKGRASVAGGARATSLRASYRAEVTDYTAFGRWAWEHRREEYREFLDGLASLEGRRGPVNIPGIIVHTERKAA